MMSVDEMSRLVALAQAGNRHAARAFARWHEARQAPYGSRRRRHLRRAGERAARQALVKEAA